MRRRIAVLGGGIAGLTAAWQLSAPECRDQFEVTVYQRDGLLGGKGASVRGAGGRIEEHGLHVWLGYYDNAFRLIRQVYAELDRERTDPGCPIRDWLDAFSPAGQVGVGQLSEAGWSAWLAAFSAEPGLAGAEWPGSPRPALSWPELLAEFVSRSIRLLADYAASIGRPAPALVGAAPRVVLSASGRRPGTRPVVPAGRRWRDLVDLVAACLRGVVADGLLAGPEGLAAIDAEDFRDWLRRHGANPRTCASPLITGMYDLVFGYRGGDRGQPGFAAGVGLMLATRFFFDYRGSLFWRMNAGMGDVVFAPLLQALRARGVRFEFFAEVTNLRLAEGAVEPTLGAVRLRRTGPPAYEPLVRVGDLPCFRPGPAADRAEEFELRVGAEVDEVVLAIPVGALPPLTAELAAASPRWRSMLDHASTVATQSLQLWLTATEDELGWPHHGSTVSGYPPPFDTYASMTHLLSREAHSDGTVGALGYFCGALADAPAEENRRPADLVRDQAITFLSGPARAVWPGAYGSGGFDWRLLAGDPALVGEQRMDAQYWRANVDPSDRYVQSLPGSIAHRLRPDDSGFGRLRLAGDWTDSGLNAGCIEAAVLSGIQAANAVRGLPRDAGVLGPSWTTT